MIEYSCEKYTFYNGNDIHLYDIQLEKIPQYTKASQGHPRHPSLLVPFFGIVMSNIALLSHLYTVSTLIISARDFQLSTTPKMGTGNDASPLCLALPSTHRAAQ